MEFCKYQAAGNDFVMIDDRTATFDHNNQPLIEKLCHRRFGIGADGVILLRNHPNFDFEMLYFNADGRIGSMCGNGARATVRFAHTLNIFKQKTTFLAFDGQHSGQINPDNNITVSMANVGQITQKGKDYFLDTGSPHHVQFVNNLKNHNVNHYGSLIRNSPEYAPAGTNVNFAEQTQPNQVFVRTYERGVENETLSCGTGVTAVALVVLNNNENITQINVKTLGGNLSVKANKTTNGFNDIYLTGPAEEVFKGNILC